MHRSTKARLALVTLLTLRRVSSPPPRLPELPVSDSLATGVSSQEIAPPDIAPAAEMPTGAVPAGDPTEAPDGSTYPENTPGRTDAYNALIRRVAAQHPAWSLCTTSTRCCPPTVATRRSSTVSPFAQAMAFTSPRMGGCGCDQIG